MWTSLLSSQCSLQAIILDTNLHPESRLQTPLELCVCPKSRLHASSVKLAQWQGNLKKLLAKRAVLTASKKTGVQELPWPMQRRFSPDAAAAFTAKTTCPTVLGARIRPGAVGSKLCSVFCAAQTLLCSLARQL